jgi:hypothetical protein
MRVNNYKILEPKLEVLNEKIYSLLKKFVRKEDCHILEFNVHCNSTEIKIFNDGLIDTLNFDNRELQD